MNFGDRTTAMDPARFRAQATGIGQTVQASAATGAARTARVVACMPPAQRAAVPRSAGYALGAEGHTNTYAPHMPMV